MSRQSVFGSSIGVGNTLMEHDGRTNFAVRFEGSQATIPLDDMPADATVVQAFLFWGGTFAPDEGINLDRDLDLRLPDGQLLNNLRVDTPRPGEPSSTLNRCVQRLHPVPDDTVAMFSCRREITALLQNLGPGGAIGTYEVSDVDLSPGDCTLDPLTCEAKFGGWAVAVMWQSPTESVKRDLVLADAFFALDEQGSNFGFSSGLSPEFTIDGLTVGGDESGEITILAWEGDNQLGVPPQNLSGNPFRCTDGRCEDFVSLRSNTSGAAVKLADASNRAGNVMNGSNNRSGGNHPGLDIDTFDIGRTGLSIINTGDTRLFLRAGSGDGAPDDGSGGSGELFLLGFTLVSVETFAPRFLNAGTEKVGLEPLAGPGETLNYILRVENDGSASATNTIIKDQLPAGVSYVAGSTVNTCGVSSADVAGTSPVLRPAGLNVGTMPIGRRCEVRFKATIDDGVGEGTVLQNFFTVQADGVPPLRRGPATTIVENAELEQPTKTVSVVGGGEPAPGATLLYRLRVDNNGSRPAPEVTISDDFPTSLEAISVVGAPAGSVNRGAGNRVEFTGITIAPGSFAEVTVNARIKAGTPSGTVIVNQGEVDQPSLDEPLRTDDPSVSNTPTDPTVVRVTAGIDLASSTKTAVDVNGGRLVPGDVVEFRIRVDKRGPAATVVTIDDELPAHVGDCVVVTPVPAGGFLSCQPGGANGTGRVSGAMAFAGAGAATFVFRVTVAATAPDGATIANTARLVPLADETLAVNVSSSPLVVFARPDLRLVKSVVDDNGGDVRVGDLLRYAFSVTNGGTVAVNSVVVDDAVAAALQVTSVLDGGTVSGQNVRWTLASLAVGATAVVRFEARVRAGTNDGTVINNAGVGDGAAPQAPVTSNTVSVVVRARPALVLTKTVVDDNGPPFRPSDVVRWTIVVENVGDGAATNVIVRDVLDENAGTAILTNGGRVVGDSVIFDRTTIPALDRLAVGASVALTFNARIDAVVDNGTIVDNQAQATTPNAPAETFVSNDPTTATPLDPTRFTITSAPALTLKKTFVDVDGGALLPGDLVTFSLLVENTGDATATAVTVTDALDPRLAFVSSDTGGSVVGGVVRFPPTTLVPGPVRVLRFTARITTPLVNGTVIANQASATATGLSPAPSDDPATATPLDPTRLVIVSRPILDTSTKTVTNLATDGDGQFNPGDRVRYTLVVANTGSEPANTVVVTDVIPAELTSIAAAGGAVSGQTVSFTLGSLAVGASRTLIVEATLRRPLANGVVVANQASIASTGQPTTLTDDPATAVDDDPTRFTVTSNPRLVVEKTVVDDNGGAVEPGDLLRWTITARNVGDRTSSAVVIDDAIDTNLVDLVALDGGVVAGNAISWTVGALAIDTTTTKRFTTRVRTPLANGTVVANQASVGVGETVPGAPFRSDDPSTAAPLDPTRVQVVSAANLATSTLETFTTAGVVTATARPGEVVEYRLVVDNSGRANGDNVVVTLPFPAGFVVVDAAGGTVVGTTVTFRFASVVVDVPSERRLRVRLPTPLDDDSALSVQGSLAGTGIVTPFVTDDPSTAPVGDPTVLVVDSEPILAVTKTFVDDDAATDDGVIEPGDTVTWRLSLTNTGDAVARNVVVTDALASTLTHVSGGRLAAGTLTFDSANDARLTALAPGAPAVVITFVTRVNADTASGTIVANQARAAAGAVNVLSDDPSTATALDPTRFTVVAVPRLVVEKNIVGANRVVAPGDIVGYTLTLRSTGTAAFSGALVDVIDPAFATVAPGPGLSFDASTRQLRATIASLAPGTVQTLTFTATVATSIGNGTAIDNQATVSSGVTVVRSDDPTTAAADDPTRITIDASPLLVVTKAFVDDNGGALLPGDRLTWAITIRNDGRGLARDISVSDEVDLATVEVVDDGDGTAAGNLVLFDASTTPALAGLARDATTTLRFAVRVREDVVDGTVLQNQARVVSADLGAPVLSDDASTAVAADPTRVTVQAPVLSFTKRTDATVFVPGDVVRYVLRVDNAGSVAATDVVITDALPAALIDGGTSAGTVAGNVLTAPIGTIAVGGNVEIVVTGRIEPSTAGGTVVSNQAELRAAERVTPLRSDDPSTPLLGDATVRIVDSDEEYGGTIELFDGDTGAVLRDEVLATQRVRARITVENTARQAGRAVVIRSPLTRGRFIADETTAGGLIDDDGDVRWTASQLPALTLLAPGQRIVVEFEGRIATPIADGTALPFSGEVTSLGESTPTIIGPVVLRVRSRPDLTATTKEVVDVDGGLVEPGDVLDWRITVLNDGGTEANDVVLVDAIPAGMRALPGTLTRGGQPLADVDLARGLALGSIGAGRSVVVGFSTRVELSAPRGVVLANQAVITARGVPDAKSDDPRTPLVVGDPTTVVVGGGGFLVAQVAGAPVPTRVGAPTTLSIALENAGTEGATDVLVRLPVPVGSTFVASSLRVDNAPRTDGTDGDDAEVVGLDDVTVQWRVGRLEAGDGRTLQFVVTPLAGTAALVAQGDVAASTGALRTDADPGTAGAQALIIPVEGQLAVLFDQDTVQLDDDNGGVLVASDAVTARARLNNRGTRDAVITSLVLTIGDGLDVDTDRLDARYVVAGNVVSLRTDVVLTVEDGGAFDVVVPLRTRDDVVRGDVLIASAEATARLVQLAGEPVVEGPIALGRDQLTVGLLPGTGAISGRVYVDGGNRDGVFAADSDDVLVEGFTVLAFWRDQPEPVQSVITDARGRYSLSPLPSGTTRLVVRGASGARFASFELGRLDDGDARTEDLAIEPGGTVWVTSGDATARGLRVALFVDDGDANADNDVRVPAAQLFEGQQDQRVGAQGFYRFDPLPGRYRVGVIVDNPLLVFPSSKVPVLADGQSALGQQVGAGDVGDVVVVDPASPPPWAARLRVDGNRAVPTRNHLPVDPFTSQVAITKTATRKRLSVGEIVTYEVRVDNKALVDRLIADNDGVEIVDTLPAGFQLVDGSYQLAEITADAEGRQRRAVVDNVRANGSRIIRFGPFDLRKSRVYALRYNVVVGPGTPAGRHENTAALRLADGAIALTEVASAVVQVVADTTFDLGSVRGKVFCDDDHDGWQDAGERGAVGTRIYLDNGTWSEADFTGKFHFSGVQPGMHLAKLDERTLLGATATSVRQSFYLSAGLPAQIAFTVQCTAETVAATEFVINEDAFRPAGAATRARRVSGDVDPLRVLVDGAVVALPTAALDVVAVGSEPDAAGGVGPNLTAVDAGLELRARTTGDVVAWQIVIDDVTTATSTVREQVDVADFDAALAAGATAAVPAPTTMTTSTAPVWVFAGKGAPPAQLRWNGHDDHNVAVLTDGHRYQATLTIGVAAGHRLSTSPRAFGVGIGASDTATTTVLASFDENDGALFSPSGKPTKRLRTLLEARAPALRDLPRVEVRAHLDAQPTAPVAQLTAARADAVRAVLVNAGLVATNIVAMGKGDAEPLFPNGREKDRQKNRRIELVVPAATRTVPALPAVASLTTPSARAADKALPVSGGHFDGSVDVVDGGALVVDVTTANGQQLRLVHGDDPVDAAAARSGLEPIPVAFDAATGALQVGGAPVPAMALLGVRAVPDLAANTVRVTAPKGLVVARTTIVLFVEAAGAPLVADDDASIGTRFGEVVVDGLPASVTLPTLPPKQTAMRLRAIVEDVDGNTGISPDVRFTVGDTAVAVADNDGDTVIADAFADDGALRPTATSSLQHMARTLPAGASLRIEAHVDDQGPRLSRLTTTQQQAERARDVVVAGGVDVARVTALGRGSDEPLAPNTSPRRRAQNRRLVVTIVPAATSVAGLVVNGAAVALKDGRYVDGVAPLTDGEVAFAVRDRDGARAFVRVRGERAEVWQGTPAALQALTAPVATTTPPSTAPATATAPTVVSVVDRAPFAGTGAIPAWWPSRAQVPAAGLVVELPPEGRVGRESYPVRGHAAIDSRVTVNGAAVGVDPLTGAFAAQVKVKDGTSEIVVEATDALGNVARVRREIVVDTSGWFVLLLADTALGGDGAMLDERSATTSLSAGPVFLYGRGAAYVKGRFKGPTLFQDYDLTLHLDTRRFEDDVFFRDVLDVDRFMPAWGDSSFEVQDARSGIPLYVEVQADASRLSVGSVRTELVGGDLLRYQRARTGAQLTFDRGWLDPVDVSQRNKDVVVDPAKDPFRTQATTFVAGGGGERHARVELMGTGGSVYFLRHERVIEGSERLAVIVRDGVTGTEIARVTKARNLDYTIRYDEGRVIMKKPVSAFADGAFIVNHNLGQVASGHRVFVEVEYEHQDDQRLQGVAGGVNVTQRVFGFLDVGGSYVAESREGGELAYQVGGMRAKLFVDEGTFIKAEVLGSQSVDAGNFVSFDGGLTYGGLGQSLDAKTTTINGVTYPKERSGLGLKLDGQWRFGQHVGRGADDGVVRAYYQALQAGFFGGGGAIIEQGQTKWGGEAAWRLTDVDELRLRYDGVLSDISPFGTVEAPRTLNRQISTGRYARRLVPGLVVAGELGYGYTGDSGSFAAPVDDTSLAVPSSFHTVITAAGVDWQVTEALQLSLKQEVVVVGDPNQLNDWNDHFITHAVARYALTKELSLDGGASVRWSGENQIHAGVGYRVNETSRVYVAERVGVLPEPGTGTMGFSNTTVIGAESEVMKGSRVYGEYQLQSAFSTQQTRGVVGLANQWALPFGLSLSLNYERITTLGNALATTQAGGVAPAAFNDGTFYAAPGQNGGGSFLYGDGTRDAASGGVEWRREDLLVFSQRLELRYDNFAEDRGGHDTAWLMSMTAIALKLSPELSMLSRYNVGLAQDLALGQRAAYLEEGTVGAAFRPIGHDWFSVLTKLSRRVDIRPIDLEGGVVDDTAIHAFALEPIVQLPWGVQLVEKLALKHMRVAYDDVPVADAITALWINRINLQALTLLRGLGIDTPLPGAVDLGLEYRVLTGVTYAGLEHGALVELQVAPVEQFRVGVGYNFTRFSDNEVERTGLEGGTIDRSGFFVRAVGAW